MIRMMRHALLIAVALMAISIPSFAQSAVFGVIDMEKAINGYTKREAMEAELKAKNDQVTANFDSLQKVLVLTPEEIDEYAKIVTSATKDDAQKKRSADLEAKATQFVADFNALAAKGQAMTAEEKTKFDSMRAQAANNENTFKQMMTDANNSILRMRDEKRLSLISDIKVAVAAIAKEQKINLVFSMNPQNVVYGAIDITDPVIKRLNTPAK
ncbi:MAG: OmpH/Skp family outer membrane protein [Armatimonadota bacterium]